MLLLVLLAADLVFLQNGMLQPWLDSRGLGDNTQVTRGRGAATGNVPSFMYGRAVQLCLLCLCVCLGYICLLGREAHVQSQLTGSCQHRVCWLQVLVYFAVAKLGDTPTDGKTDVNPEGLTAGGQGQRRRGKKGWYLPLRRLSWMTDILSPPNGAQVGEANSAASAA